jgi:hypothetical protein
LFKLSIGLVYTERTGVHLNILEDFIVEREAFARNILKLTRG